MKKLIPSAIFTCLCFYSNFSLAQDNPVFNDIVGKLTSYNEYKNPEKTYIITDKDFYVNGETIWYKVLLLNGSSHAASDKSNLVYVELTNDKDSVVAQQKLFNKGFGVQGNIEIAETLEKGQYVLHAYTKYMLNEKQPILHSKKITVQVSESPNKLSNLVEENTLKKNTSTAKLERPDITFFPEGGNLVSGIQSFLGVKITDGAGNGIALKGKIFDENDNLISVFKTHEFGLGKAVLTPKSNKKYFAKITVNNKTETYPLPNALETGYALRVTNWGEYVELDITTNIINGLKETMLVGHIRGRMFFKHIEKNSDAIYSLKLLTKELEDGVAHFTLFTAEGEPVCERLVFIDNPENDVVLTTKLNSTVYNQREKVSVKLDLKDKKGLPLKGNLTTSVITNTNPSNNTGNGIKSWLLLNSDIGGTITNANYFFKNNNSETNYLLDALMLTHGWRRFVWKDLLNKNVTKSIKFKPEKGIMIEGRIKSFKNKYKSKQSLVSLNFINGSLFQEKKKTNPQGMFSFGPFNFNDSINVLLQANPIKKIKENDNNDLAIHFNDNFPKLSFNKNSPESTPTTIKLDFPEKYLTQARKRKVEKFKYDSKAIVLKEVSVEAEKKKTRRELVNEELKGFTRYNTTPNSRVFTDSIAGTESISALDLLNFVAGIQVQGSFPNQRLFIPRNVGISFREGATEPLIFLDGLPVDLAFISNLRANQVMFVDFLIGSSASIYGIRGAAGVIAFYSNRQLRVNLTEKEYPNIANFKINGFSKVREFYSPNYDVPKPKHERADYRTTLYWKPNITITDSKSASFSFFTGDFNGEYSLKVEGVTLDGRPVSTVKTFMVGGE